jgi:hypothetical protein
MALEWNQFHYYGGHIWACFTNPRIIVDDNWVAVSGMNEWQRKPQYLEKTCPSAALFTTNPM